MTGVCRQVARTDPQAQDAPRAYSRADLKRCTPEVVALEMPDGGLMHVRGITGPQYERLTREIQAIKKNADDDPNLVDVPGIVTTIILWGACDADGVAFYDEADAGDAAEVDALTFQVRTALLTAILEVSGLGEDAIENAAKN
jgi:hypothetical protein